MKGITKGILVLVVKDVVVQMPNSFQYQLEGGLFMGGAYNQIFCPKFTFVRSSFAYPEFREQLTLLPYKFIINYSFDLLQTIGCYFPVEN